MSSKPFIVINIIILIINYCKSNELPDVCQEGLKCVPKCCPENHYLSEEQCVVDGKEKNVDIIDYSKVLVYKENMESTGKSLEDIFRFVKSVSIHVEETTPCDVMLHPYLLENGKLLIEYNFDNAAIAPLLLESKDFCIDYRKEQEEYYIVFRSTQPKKGDSVKDTLNTIAFIISSIFLVLVLIVYTMFSSLRNLVGKIIMSLSFSLLGVYVTMVVLIVEVQKEWALENFCITTNFFLYFFILASFLWMNVFAFDIWKQFRSQRLRSYNEENCERQRKFMFYSMYAFGTPVILVIIILFIELDIINVTTMPKFIKPNIVLNGCFFGDKEKLYYIYVPMLILLCTNWVFFSLTAFSIWRTKQTTYRMGMKATPSSVKLRLKIFLKLSLIMGINWVLEAISSFKPNLPIWYITDLYNILIGVGIFIIAVCNKKVYTLFKKRFGDMYLQTEVNSSRARQNQTQELTISDEPLNETQMNLMNYK